MAELALGVHFLYFYDSMGKDLENTKLITTLTSSYGIDPTFTQSVDFAQYRVSEPNKLSNLSLFNLTSFVIEFTEPVMQLMDHGRIFTGLSSLSITMLMLKKLTLKKLTRYPFYPVQLLRCPTGYRLRALGMEKAEFGRDRVAVPHDMLSIK